MTETISTDGDAEATNTPTDTQFEKTTLDCSTNCSDDDLESADVSVYPDFSKLKGTVCLDSLSVRELQQTFRATFGRNTDVKDKMWLKRRIAMSLCNSCKIPSMTFLIEDEKVVEIDGVEVKQVEESKRDFEKVNVCVERAAKVELEADVGGDQSDREGGKRVRKPTKRYIEELSKVEPNQHGVRHPQSVRISSSGRTICTPRRLSINSLYSDEKSARTLMYSIGGSRVQVPFASRGKRSRPRENIASLLLKLPEENRESPLPDAIELQPKLCQKNEPMDSVPSTSDDNQNTVPPVTVEIFRKHRTWTLSEVTKLVDGVAKYGAGKWSEIKRLSFTSYPYRSSVDLKDKWRNLLKVSFADSSQDTKKACSRKQIQTPLPAAILAKVRELAERQGHIPLISVSTKIIGSCERGPGSGFL